MMYNVIHYYDFGFEADSLYRTPNLESARKECARYGNNDNIEEGYEIRDENGDLVG